MAKTRRSSAAPANAGAAESTRRSSRLVKHGSSAHEEPGSSLPELAPPAQQHKQPRRKRGRNRRAGAVAQASPQPKKQKAQPVLTGLWDLLPTELVDAVLELCNTRQLAMLETSCSFFRATKIIENIAEMRLRAIPRAKGITPNKEANETYTSVLHFILSQSAAAAQATAIAFGAHHTTALLIPEPDTARTGHHSLYTCGRGFYGQLGHGDYKSTQDPKLLCIGYQASVDVPEMEEEITPAVVACGMEFSASITRRGQLLTWGLGTRGELGHDLPNAGEVPYPVRATLSSRPTVRVVSVACGSSHTLAISELGTVWACGRNQDGQLGIANFADSMQLVPVAGMKGQRIVSCAAGASHSMALASDGSLFTWGGGKHGQLGHSSLHAIHLMVPNQPIVLATPQKIAMLEPASLKPWRRVTSIASGNHHACAVTVSGALLVFGRNKHGQLGTGDTEDRWRPTQIDFGTKGEPNDVYRTVQVACGLQHSLALIAHRGKVQPFAAGANVWGQLGLGHQITVNKFTAITPLTDNEVVAVQAGDHTSAAICDNGDIWLWGRNDWGQLGTGDDISRWSPMLLPGFKAVHPDKTLRKSKRSAPRMRPAVPPQQPAAPKALSLPAVLAKHQAASAEKRSDLTPHLTTAAKEAANPAGGTQTRQLDDDSADWDKQPEAGTATPPVPTPKRTPFGELAADH